jgi:hypothetical protein
VPRARVVVQDLKPGHDSYEPFWKHCLWSSDGRQWERIPDAAQEFSETRLAVMASLGAKECLWIAEAFPLAYGHYARLRERLAAPAASGVTVRRQVLCETAGGRPVEAFRISGEKSRAERHLLLIAGQHAVEESGKILAETVLRGYHGGAFAGTPMEALLETHSVTVVPLANPDGCFDGRMNTNGEGIVMDHAPDDSRETRAQLALVDEIRPSVVVNCHGWGNESGRPPHEDVYRWTDEDPLYAYLKAHVPGCSTTAMPHLLVDFPIEAHARERCGSDCIIVEINWNWFVPADGGPARQPTFADVQARAGEYFAAIAGFCLEEMR